ncbi:MAG: site-specific DNA inversion stimulation factor [Alphaproteobacteria bacterium]|nr:site-specific DNA inversion stimulation factor [Alphaproteobacteria bacterium]
MRSKNVATEIATLLDEFFLIQKDINKVQNVYNVVMREVEIAIIKKVMRAMNGNKTKMSQVLGISRNTLNKKIQKLGINE